MAVLIFKLRELCRQSPYQSILVRLLHCYHIRSIEFHKFRRIVDYLLTFYINELKKNDESFDEKYR